MLSTTTKSRTTYTASDDAPGLCCLMAVVLLIGMAAALFLCPALDPDQNIPATYLTVAVESTTVRYYNITADGRVDSIIGVGIRAANPDPDGPPLNLTSLRLLVKKDGLTIASGGLPGVFNLTAGSEEVVHGEALGLVPVPDPHGQSYLDAQLDRDVRADLAAGEGIVKVELNGCLGELSLVAICLDVVIDCSRRSAARAQQVYCQLSGHKVRQGCEGECG